MEPISPKQVGERMRARRLVLGMGQALYLSAASLSSGPFPQGGTTVRIVGNSDVMAVTQAAGTATATVSVVCCLNVPPPHYP